jgi:hypothetical protein
VDAGKEKEIAARYRVSAYPTIAFLNPDGTVRKSVRGFHPPESFIPLMKQVLDTRSQQFHLSDRAAQDQAARAEYAQILALGGQHQEAAAQLELLLRTTEGEARANLELDRLVYLVLADGEGLESVRSALDDWLNDHEKHDRRWEAAYYLARAEDRTGRAKHARTLFEEVATKAVGRWFATDAARRLEAFSS